uniref:Uncharacterized protein n=1 Tax=Arundo donax TaxID=35708 RepID=A0A0A9B2S7_ARUDO
MKKKILCNISITSVSISLFASKISSGHHPIQYDI